MKLMHRWRGWPWLVLAIILPNLEAKEPGQITQSTTVTIGSDRVTLNPGQSIEVLSQTATLDTIRFTASDGSVAIVQIPAANLELISALPHPAPGSSPGPTPATNTPPANPLPDPTSAQNSPPPSAKPVLIKPPAPTAPFVDPFSNEGAILTPTAPVESDKWHAGWQIISYRGPVPDDDGHKSLNLGSFAQDVPSDHCFLYLPKGYDPQTPYKLLIWLDTSHNGRLPDEDQDFLDKNNIVVIGPQNLADLSKHSEETTKLRLSATLMATMLNSGMVAEKSVRQDKRVTIDPNNIVIGGFALGAQAACLGGFCYPHIVRGVLACGGILLLDDSVVTKDPGHFWGGLSYYYGAENYPSSNTLSVVYAHTHFAFIIGTLDPFLQEVRDVAQRHREENIRLKVFLVPDLEHTLPSPDYLQQALDFILK